MLFLASTKREAELLFCGLKLLLECETARLGVRGGVPLNKLGGKLGKGALSPVAARGTQKPRSTRSSRRDRSDIRNRHHLSRRGKEDLDDRSKYSSFGEPGTSSDDESETNNNYDESQNSDELEETPKPPPSDHAGRNQMRQQLASSGGDAAISSPPIKAAYEFGKVVCTDIATNISLPLPLTMCRVLFLDSSSPVNESWEASRKDSDYRHDAWSFPPGSLERSSASEQQLIARSSMVGAQRTISYSRKRSRELVRLSEAIVVEQDDDQALVYTVTDQMPRRGFSVKARVHLRSFGSQRCEARVVTEICPVGKNLADQQAVNKAFLLVLDEMKKRYGSEEKGLLAVFLDVYNTLPGQGPGSTRTSSASPRRSQAGSQSITSFKDVLPGSNNATDNSTTVPRQTQSARVNGNANNSTTSQQKQSQRQERPSTPSMRTIDSKAVGVPQPRPPLPLEDEFADFKRFAEDVPPTNNPVTVEVKPLPKIRLDLCPVPREEDEEENDSVQPKRKSRSSSKRRHGSRSKNR